MSNEKPATTKEKPATTKPAAPRQQSSFKAILKSDAVKNRFAEVLNANPENFISTLLVLYNANDKLQKCSTDSILAAAGFAAAHNLSVSPSFGEAYIIPYNGEAQFQISYRGLIQLALRTREYRTINVSAVYEGEILGKNCITGELTCGEKISDKIVGYVAYFELLYGFSKALYMTVEEIDAHAQAYSQSYKADKSKGWNSSIWSTNFDAMAKKTVLKNLLSVFGPKSNSPASSSLSTAMQGDQAVISKNHFKYVDSDNRTVAREDTINIEAQLAEEQPAEEPPAEQPTEGKPAEEPAPELVNNETGEVVGEQKLSFGG